MDFVGNDLDRGSSVLWPCLVQNRRDSRFRHDSLRSCLADDDKHFVHVPCIEICLCVMFFDPFASVVPMYFRSTRTKYS